MAQSILIVEDDPDIAQLIAFSLQQAKYHVEVASDGEKGLRVLERDPPPAMVILDLMLPGKDGLSICRSIKSNARTKNLPVLMVTAKGEEADRIVGFEMGADDYLSKPFSPRELVLRVQAIFKRMKTGLDVPKVDATVVTEGRLVIDPIRHEISFDGKPIVLTLLEFRLLHYLITRKDKVANRDTLLNEVWGYDPALTTRTVDTHIKRLRQKLGKAGNPLETVRGVGYCWRSES
ncbi:MAG: DNA-binding response regulator [Deltaproteobacteria bacterium CG11_big_fil_rev_8_21_14_0_20_47_16]|nr:MAG: DNA-binding response regulator [Deltaproteobacteria bacterium CG11_big_fil_rev_8_21_14_0_20_47_16]